MRKVIVLFVVLLVFLGFVSAGRHYFPTLFQHDLSSLDENTEKVKVVSEESVTIDIVKKSGPAVVTIAEAIPQRTRVSDTFDPFDFFNQPLPTQSKKQPEPQGIGSGFILDKEGLIVTNKHVVADKEGTYFVITPTEKKYSVKQIYRDPVNDISLLKIDPSENHEQLKTITLGDSGKLQVGQYVVAIGTALGEFRNTVTTGVISGLGRGITAGTPFEGVERLDNVIQTDAAINPGNSGGPLLNSAGQVIGVNTAISSNGQNIGFAIPINLIKESLDNFNKTGKFDRSYLGVAYKMVSKKLAILNDVPEGAYVQGVISGSPADTAGIKAGDIIMEIDGNRITEKNPLSGIIGKKKVGDTITIKIYRDGKTQEFKATLTNSTEQ